MGERDEQRLTQLLRQGEPAPLDAATAEEVYARAWETIRAGMADEEHGAAGEGRDDRVAARRLDVIAAAEAGARRRRRMTRTSAIATAVLLAGAGTAAAGTYLAARTGEHSTGWHVQAAGPGEFLNMAGSDYVEVVRELIADIPFAPGYEHLHEAEPFTPYLRNSTPAGESGTLISESAVRGSVAQDAICTWADAWVAADTSGDAAARDAATAALAEFLDSSAVRDLDPNPSPTGLTDPEGKAWPTRFGWLPAIVTAAQSGQRAAVMNAVNDSSSCGSDYIPVIVAAPDYAGPA